MLHKNLDTSVDMGDGERAVRSSKYELPIYHITNKVEYSIGSIHLTGLTSGILSEDQSERLVANRFVNLQGGKNNNISLDKYLEMLNRDSKIACSGHKTKYSIISHSKEYPHLINFNSHFDNITDVKGRKGFHHIPSYKEDVCCIKSFEGLKTSKCAYTYTKTLLQMFESICRKEPFSGCTPWFINNDSSP